MLKVGFWFDAPANYSGGINYIKNTLYALSLVNDGSVHPYIFFSSDIPSKIVEEFTPLAKVVRTKILQRGTLLWFIQKLMYKAFGSMALINALLKSHEIEILSHVWFPYKGSVPFRVIGWIPDFQYLHLPEFFPDIDANKETRNNRDIISQSDLVILSSHNALEDFQSIVSPENKSRGTVLQFVSQTSNTASLKVTSLESIEQKYGFNGKFFFLPNQFWVHKNHMLVLQAIKLLKDRGIDVLVLCTGTLEDMRVKNSRYIDDIYDFINDNRLQAQVKILGHIDYDDVLVMMRNSLAVINPSRFEGWSSSVEEAKSMGKPIILSNIGVHIEQNPLNGRYIDPDDALGLSKILEEIWFVPADISQEKAEEKARQLLHKRTVEFGNNYLKIIKEVEQRTKPCNDSLPSRSNI
jgi:glycosyltransferase involved in cell wall biosynthesis